MNCSSSSSESVGICQDMTALRQPSISGFLLFCSAQACQTTSDSCFLIKRINGRIGFFLFDGKIQSGIFVCFATLSLIRPPFLPRQVCFVTGISSLNQTVSGRSLCRLIISWSELALITARRKQIKLVVICSRSVSPVVIDYAINISWHWWQASLARQFGSKPCPSSEQDDD